MPLLCRFGHSLSILVKSSFAGKGRKVDLDAVVCFLWGVVVLAAILTHLTEESFVNFFDSKEGKMPDETRAHHVITDLWSPELVCASVECLGFLFFAVLFSLFSSSFFPPSTVPTNMTTLLLSSHTPHNSPLTRPCVQSCLSVQSSSWLLFSHLIILSPLLPTLHLYPLCLCESA